MSQYRRIAGRNEPLHPGVDNDRIVAQLVAITEKDGAHAKVKRRKDGSLSISAVLEKVVS